MKPIHLTIFVILFPASLFAQNTKAPPLEIKFDHLRINVSDKKLAAQWYVDHVGLEVLPSSNDEVICVADKDHNFMFEFRSIPNIRNTYQDIPVDGFHAAFEGRQTIEKVAEEMLKNGATQEGEIYRNKIGDYVINVAILMDYQRN